MLEKQTKYSVKSNNKLNIKRSQEGEELFLIVELIQGHTITLVRIGEKKYTLEEQKTEKDSFKIKGASTGQFPPKRIKKS